MPLFPVITGQGLLQYAGAITQGAHAKLRPKLNWRSLRLPSHESIGRRGGASEARAWVRIDLAIHGNLNR